MEELLLNQLMNSIEVFLEKMDTFLNRHHVRESWTGFYIGKTNDLQSARERHKEQGRPYLWQLSSEGDPALVGFLEKELISYFGNQVQFSNMLENVGQGNEGNNEANMLYVTISYNIQNIEELGINLIIEPDIIDISK